MLHDLPAISRIYRNCLHGDSVGDISDDNDHLQIQQGSQPERSIIEDDCPRESTNFETFMRQFESAADRAYSTGIRKNVKFSINISKTIKETDVSTRTIATDYEIYTQIRKKERELDAAMIAMSNYVIYRDNTGETQTFTLDGRHIKSKKLKSLFIKFSAILFEYIRLRAILASRMPVNTL